MLCVNARFLSRQITGAQRYAVEIARQIKRIDGSVRFLAPPDIEHRDIAEELEVEIVGRRKGIAWEQIDLPRHLKRNGRPLLLGMSFTAPLFYRPTMIAVHDVCFLRRDEVSAAFHHYYKFLVPRLCRRAAMVITVSEFSKGEIVEHLGVPADKIEVVYNAVSPDFVEKAAEVTENRHGAYVLGVATLQKRKNFGALVRAFLALDDPNTKLVIVGSADRQIYGAESDLDDLLGDPRIHLTGYVSDAELAALYRDAQVFVYPSLYEGFGIPPIEAMSMGCPVITSNVTSIPEVCGDAAHYVDPRDEGALTEAIRTVLASPDYRRELVERGTERAKRYDWRRSAERMLEIARSL